MYLEKQGFKPDGAAVAAKNFKDTMALVPTDSEGYNTSEDGELSSGGAPMATDQVSTSRTGRPGFFDVVPPVPNAPVRVVMNGNRLEIQASVDLEGLKKLQSMLEKYQGILEMMEPESK